MTRFLSKWNLHLFKITVILRLTDWVWSLISKVFNTSENLLTNYIKNTTAGYRVKMVGNKSKIWIMNRLNGSIKKQLVDLSSIVRLWLKSKYLPSFYGKQSTRTVDRLDHCLRSYVNLQGSWGIWRKLILDPSKPPLSKK